MKIRIVLFTIIIITAIFVMNLAPKSADALDLISELVSALADGLGD